MSLSLLADYDAAVGASTPPDWVVPDEPDGYLAARLPVAALAQGSVAVLAASVNRFAVAAGAGPRTWRLSMERIAASFASDRLFRFHGRPVDRFAELSGFFRAADGWVRTHGNYPHHRTRLLRALELPGDTDQEAFAARVARLPAQDVEDAATEAGAIAVRVRGEAEWAASEPGRAAAAAPLVGVRADPEDVAVVRTRPRDPGRPLAGIRVLDFTRVIAGPVATRALALLGATVLRVDSPRLPELTPQHTDTGQGKHTTLLDLATGAGLARANELLAGADLLITGYRPGALERYGLLPPPGLVRARVAAWSDTGPWAARRGFDSIVQAASGIALIEGDADHPGALPVQALDHASGYLLAAAALDALRLRDADGLARDVSVRLAGTAGWLLQASGRSAAPVPPRQPGSAATVLHGAYETARPALAEYDDYPWPAHPWGSDAAEWVD